MTRGEGPYVPKCPIVHRQRGQTYHHSGSQVAAPDRHVAVKKHKPNINISPL